MHKFPLHKYHHKYEAKKFVTSWIHDSTDIVTTTATHRILSKRMY